MSTRQIKITQALIQDGVTTHMITGHILLDRIIEAGAPKKYILENIEDTLDKLLKAAQVELKDGM
jgi:hypothetical protein